MIGRLLRPVRAGEKHLAFQHPAVRDAPDGLVLSSRSLSPDGHFPVRCAGPGVGDNLSPALSWVGLPEGTRELVLIIEDPSAPLPRPFVHAVVVSIPPTWAGVAEGGLGDTAPLLLGRTSLRRREYTGPRPVPGHGPHSYAIQLFAAREALAMGSSFGRSDVLSALAGVVLAKGRLDGIYER
jgi:Raf kinase inhibitor-like YbhB/YbcL family protein